MMDFIKTNWKPICGSILLVAIYLLSKHPAMVAERELLEQIALLWGVIGFTSFDRVQRGD